MTNDEIREKLTEALEDFDSLWIGILFDNNRYAIDSFRRCDAALREILSALEANK